MENGTQAQQEQINSLQTELGSMKELASKAAEKIEELETENSLLKEDNESLKAEVARLVTTPDDKEKSNGVGETFAVEGKKYMILGAAIRIPKLGRMTALEILASAEAKEILVKKQSGFIKEVF